MESYYDAYENTFNHDVEILEARFRATIADITNTFGSKLITSEFRRIPLFYSLFAALHHLRYGLPSLNQPTLGDTAWNYSRIETALESVEQVVLTEEKRSLGPAEAKFLEDTRLATTDAAVRVRRTEFILSKITYQN